MLEKINSKITSIISNEENRMKTLMCSLLILSLGLFTVTASYAQAATDIEALRAADVNADGTINIQDLVRIASHLGEIVTEAQPLTPDVNGDGHINILDLVLVANRLGETVPPLVACVGAAPESGVEITPNDSITLTFDNTPMDVTVSAGTATIDGNRATIEGPFTPGALELTITWEDGTETFTYTVTKPDTEAPSITGGTIRDGDTDVNARAAIEVEFSEEIRGLVTLRTEADNNVGWVTTFDGNKVMLTPVEGKALDPETTYTIAVKVRDAAGNRTDINISFTTASAYDGIPIEVTDANFDSIVLASKVPVVVEFYTDW